MSTLLTFIGLFEKLSETANLNDLCIVDGKNYVYINTWQEMGMYCIESDIVQIENQTLIIWLFIKLCYNYYSKRAEKPLNNKEKMQWKELN